MTAPHAVAELRSLATMHPQRVGTALCAWDALHATLDYVAGLEAEVAAQQHRIAILNVCITGLRNRAEELKAERDEIGVGMSDKTVRG